MRLKISLTIAFTALFLCCFADDLEIDCQIRKNKVCEVTVESFKIDDKLNLKVPDDLDYEDIKEIKFKDSKLEKFPGDIFEKFTKLMTLNVEDAQLTELKKESFTNAKYLEKLKASRNEITELTEYIFEYAPELQEIDLSKNKITTIHSNAFHSNLKLVTLDFSENHIKLIENNLFDSNPDLLEINFFKNPIYAIGPNILDVSTKKPGYTLTLTDSKCAPEIEFTSKTKFIEISQCLVMYSVEQVKENLKEMNAKIADNPQILQNVKSEILSKQQAEFDLFKNDLNGLTHKINMTQVYIDDYKLKSNASYDKFGKELDLLRQNYEMASIGVIGLAALCGFCFVYLIYMCTKKTPKPKYGDPESLHFTNNKLELKESSSFENPKSDKNHYKKEEMLKKPIVADSESDSESESSDSSSD